MLPRPLTALAAALLLAAAGAGTAAAQLPACGGLLQPPCPAPATPAPPATTTTTTTTPAPAPPPATEPAPPIPAALFTQVEGFVASALASQATYERTCDALPTDEPVLAAFRRRCKQDLVTVGLYRKVIACRSAACARRRSPVFARELHVEARTLTGVDRAVAAEVPAGACRTALQYDPETHRQFGRLVRGWTTYARAFRQRSDAVLRQAHRQLRQVDFSKGRSTKAQLRDLRASCR